MQVKVEKLSPVLVECSVQVDADTVKSELDKAYNSVAKTAKVRGFRPGKAPRKVLSHVYGRRIELDVAKRLVDDTFPKAISEQKLIPLNAPAIEQDNLDANKSFSYKARFEVVPEISEVKYEGLSANKPPISVTDEQVQAELQRLREANATLEAPDPPRPSQKGDVVVLDLEVSVGGKRIEEATAHDYRAELGASSLLKEIDEALLGKQPGETVEVDVAMPANHPHEKLRGKEARFRLTLKDLKQNVLPEADDEFAKDLGEYDSLADLKQHLLERLETRAKEERDNRLAEQLVMELVKANEIAVPPSLIEQQMKVAENEILGRARAQGQQVTGVGEALRSQIRADSEVKVKAGLLMAEIAKKEGIKVGNEEIEEGLSELAAQTGKNIAKLRAEYRDKRQREMLIGMILENKVLDIIEAKANITEEAPRAEATP